jgi:squalene-associated FAD-dependent desaturase
MTRFARAHIVGAGLAGLAAALRLAEAGVAVTVHEAAPQAGGRCRSYFDAALGCRIDNGNHLLISGNWAAQRYLAGIGAAQSLIGPDEAAYPFIDLASGERWVFRPGAGRVPWWLFDRTRRVPSTHLRDYLRALRLAWVGRDQAVADVLDPRSVLFCRLWRPLTVAVLNTGVEEASAALLAHVLGESFAKGGTMCRPLVPSEGLSETFIEPALQYLREHGAQLRFAARLRAIEFAGDRVAGLGFDGDSETVTDDEAVVLAVPAPVAARLIPGLTAPQEFRAIVNAHYRIRLPNTAPLLVGIVGGVAEWVFRKREVLSVTVSAADRLVDTPAEELSLRLWHDAAKAYELPTEPMPPWQIVKERRATFAATPAQIRRRPMQATRWSNLTLAGDWTDTGLPATIEGAIRSGFAAAEGLLASSRRVGKEKRLSASGELAKVAAGPPPPLTLESR